MAEASHEEFLVLYRPVHEQFARFCNGLAYGLTDPNDLVQETVLITLNRFHTLREKEKLLGFMIAIATNLIRNQARRNKFTAQFNELAFKRLESKTPGPEIALDIHHLYVAMQQLTVKDREAILLFEINGFSIEEIAAIQDSSPGAAKTRLSRAREKLRLLLEDNESEKRRKPVIAILFTPTLIPMKTEKIFESIRNLPVDMPVEQVEQIVHTAAKNAVAAKSGGLTGKSWFSLNNAILLVAAGAVSAGILFASIPGTHPLGDNPAKKAVAVASFLPADHSPAKNVSMQISPPVTTKKNLPAASSQTILPVKSKPGNPAPNQAANKQAPRKNTFVPEIILPMYGEETMYYDELAYDEETIVPCDTCGKRDSLELLIENALLADSLIKSRTNYCFKISGYGMKVNGKKQSKETFRKYKKLVETKSPNKVSRHFVYSICVDGVETTIRAENYVN
jgi:RNA polymerase sigma-70 factor, ECF subfamily